MPFGLIPFNETPFGLMPFGLIPFGLIPFGLIPFGLIPFGLFPFGLMTVCSTGVKVGSFTTQPQMNQDTTRESVLNIPQQWGRAPLWLEQ
jgi:hypothetical protein